MHIQWPSIPWVGCGGGGEGEVFFKADRGLVYAMYSNVTWPCF